MKMTRDQHYNNNISQRTLLKFYDFAKYHTLLYTVGHISFRSVTFLSGVADSIVSNEDIDDDDDATLEYLW